jgi:hypothetical protein
VSHCHSHTVTCHCSPFVHQKKNHKPRQKRNVIISPPETPGIRLLEFETEKYPRGVLKIGRHSCIGGGSVRSVQGVELLSYVTAVTLELPELRAVRYIWKVGCGIREWGSEPSLGICEWARGGGVVRLVSNLHANALQMLRYFLETLGFSDYAV